MRKLLAQGAFWTLNKEVTRRLGSLEASLLLTMLLDQHNRFPEKEMVFLRIKDIEKETGLSYYNINKAMTLLVDRKLVYKEKEKKANPVMMYKVFEVEILKLLRLKDSTSKGQRSGTHKNNIQRVIKEKEKECITNIFDEVFN